MASERIIDLWHQPVKSIAVPPGALVMLNQNDTVGRALQTLKTAGLLSAPVIDYIRNQVVGYVDVLDLLIYALNVPFGTYYTEEGLAVIRERLSHPIRFMRCQCQTTH